MKQIEYFLDFYKSLNTPGMVLFWLIVVLFFFLFFSLIAVLLKNQELRKIIIKLRTEEKKNKENKVENKASFNNNALSTIIDSVLKLSKNINANNGIPLIKLLV